MNVSHYDETARGINSPMYAYYAEKIREKTAITQGVCLDVGSSGGYLGLALAKITDLVITFLDISAEGLERAKQHIVEEGIAMRATTLLADVHQIPLADSSVNLVISRGSIPFWADPAKALKEIHRVLVPGGEACVICGRGTPEIQAVIKSRRGDAARKGPLNIPKRDYEDILKKTGIGRVSFNRGDDGFWIRLWK
jgi:ubiquinone/menaquinone biosynthesis C-methylase UbiE